MEVDRSKSALYKGVRLGRCEVSTVTIVQPYERVKRHYTLPFTARTYQEQTINELAVLDRAGYYLDTGTGKTFCSTVSALYKRTMGAHHVLVIMPPILITGWARFLKSIPEVSVTTYRGTPAQRKKLPLAGDFILMSMQIFKKDYERLCSELDHKSLVVIVDEATSVKNVASDNYKKVRDFTVGQHLMLLTGTPLSTPLDGYAFIKQVAPTVYRNLHQFENIHVAERDFFGTVTAWKNLELLADNLKVNSVRLLKTDVLQDLPSISYDPVFYELDAAHYRLYKTLAEEQLLPLKDGGKIDATVEQALHHALQQIVCNYDYFADDPSCVSNTIELVKELVEELGDKKLLVFANYRMTNRKLIELLKPYGAVGAFGDLTTTQQRKNIDHFIDSSSCRILVAQPTSAGYGVDGLQHVCQETLFVELPSIPRDFHQAVARLWREGQKEKVTVRIAVAERTLQVRKLKQMLAKDELVSKVQKSYADLRKEIFGGDG